MNLTLSVYSNHEQVCSNDEGRWIFLSSPVASQPKRSRGDPRGRLTDPYITDHTGKVGVDNNNGPSID